MLHSLSIRDLAVVGRVDLAMSGAQRHYRRDWASRSILVDALSLIAGLRGDSGAVRRTGAERTEIAAEFDLAALPVARSWLAEQALDEDTARLLRRVVRADGGSRGFINGRPATLTQMRELAGMLVEFMASMNIRRCWLAVISSI